MALSKPRLAMMGGEQAEELAEMELNEPHAVGYLLLELVVKALHLLQDRLGEEYSRPEGFLEPEGVLLDGRDA